MATPQRTRVRHDRQTRELVRTLDEGGWTPYEIEKHLRRMGVEPCPAFATIKAWLDPEYAAVRNRRSLEDRRRSRDVSGDYVRKRMLELREAGLSAHDVSVVVGMYHGRDISEEMVRYYWREAEKPLVA